MTTSAPYYGDSAVMRTPPPDLPSLLLKERIVYLGLPLFSDDNSKRQMGIDVTELIIAQLLFLEFDNPEKPIYFYINSTGTSWYSGAHHLHWSGDGHSCGDLVCRHQGPEGSPSSLLHRSSPTP